jgi:hypothetical protein
MVGMTMRLLSDIVTNPDWKNSLEHRSVSSMMMFDKPEMMPEEELLPILNFIKVMIIVIPVLTIWTKIVKPLIVGG